MFLYVKKNNKFIDVYNLTSDKEGVKAYKERHRAEIRSVRVYVANKDVWEILFSSPKIMFNALDRKEENGISHIEDTHNDEIIAQYINGELDNLHPTVIIGDVPRGEKSFYSGDINDSDYLFLFEYGTSGHYLSSISSHRIGETSEGILLGGILQHFQPLLSDNINNLQYPDDFEFSPYQREFNKSIVEFFSLLNCQKVRRISLDQLRFLEENHIITFNDGVDKTFERSENVLETFNKVKQIKRNEARRSY